MKESGRDIVTNRDKESDRNAKTEIKREWQRERQRQAGKER